MSFLARILAARPRPCKSTLLVTREWDFPVRLGGLGLGKAEQRRAKVIGCADRWLHVGFAARLMFAVLLMEHRLCLCANLLQLALVQRVKGLRVILP